MPVYTYRREDGTTFDIRQKFLDDPLNICPTTGQHVTRIIQNAGIIFKGSGFYVNDSKGASKQSVNGKASGTKEGTSSETSKESKSDAPAKKEKVSSSAAD